MPSFPDNLDMYPTILQYIDISNYHCMQPVVNEVPEYPQHTQGIDPDIEQGECYICGKIKTIRSILKDEKTYKICKICRRKYKYGHITLPMTQYNRLKYKGII